MVMEYATITGTVVTPGTTAGIPGELRATPRTTNGVLTFPAEDVTTIGYARADVTSDGSLDPELQIPTDVPEGLTWRLTFHPKGKGNLPVHLGDYPITASGDLADLVPITGTVYGGFTDHGEISGTLEVTAGSHELDLTGDLEVTIVGTGDVTLHVHGPGTITVAGTDFDVEDGTEAVILIITSPRGVQNAYLAGGGSGEPVTPDTTPPSAVTDLAVDPDEDGVTAVATFTPATDAESTVKYRYRLYESGDTAPAWPTSGSQYNLAGSPINLTGLAAGTDYVMEIQAYSAGGSAASDTAMFTTPTPAGWNTYDTLTAALIGADGDRGATADFTTTGGRTWRIAGGGGGNISVAGSKVRVPNTNTDSIASFVTGAPAGYVALELDYANLNINSGYYATGQIRVAQQTGSAIVYIMYYYGNDKRLLAVGSDFSNDFTVAAGPGVTLTSNQLLDIPASGHVRVEPEGQLLRVYLDDSLIMTADFTAATYSGSPNPLLGTVPGSGSFRAQNGFEATNIEWETYA